MLRSKAVSIIFKTFTKIKPNTINQSRTLAKKSIKVNTSSSSTSVVQDAIRWHQSALDKTLKQQEVEQHKIKSERDNENKIKNRFNNFMSLFIAECKLRKDAPHYLRKSKYDLEYSIVAECSKYPGIHDWWSGMFIKEDVNKMAVNILKSMHSYLDLLMANLNHLEMTAEIKVLLKDYHDKKIDARYILNFERKASDIPDVNYDYLKYLHGKEHEDLTRSTPKNKKQADVLKYFESEREKIKINTPLTERSKTEEYYFHLPTLMQDNNQSFKNRLK